MRQQQRRAKDKTTKWYRLVAVGAVGVGFFSLLVYTLVYKEAIRTAEIDLPVIKAPDTPVKRRPDHPGGMEIPNRDKTVYDLLAEEVRQPKQEVAVKPALAPQKEVVQQPKPEPKPVVAQKSPKVEEKPKLAPVKQVEPKKAEPKAVVVKKVEPIQEQPQPKPQEVKGNWGVQLASFVANKDAEAALSKYKGKYTELSNLLPRVQKVELGQGKGVRYRAQFVGLAKKQDAQSLCNKLKKRNQGCLHIKR